MEIKFGASFVNTVTIGTNEYTATARFEPKTNSVICRTKRTPSPLSFLSKHPYWPIPKLIRLILINQPGWKAWSFLSTFLVLTIPFEIWVVATHKSVQINPWSRVLPFLFMTTIILLLVRTLIASWHAAEHMAINAYDNGGKTSIEDIRKESRIAKKCGGRFLFPYILGGIAVAYLSRFLPMPVILNIIFMEMVLWVDSFFSWDRIPVFSQISFLLQKYVTTINPGMIEIFTAKVALDALLERHQQ